MVFTRPVTTVEAVNIAASSITPGQMVRDVPGQMTLTLNRPAVSLQGAHLYLVNGDARQEVPVAAELSEATITVRFSEPLARSASFVVAIENITAADGGFLALPYALAFKTSGGPKVLGTNIG